MFPCMVHCPRGAIFSCFHAWYTVLGEQYFYVSMHGTVPGEQYFHVSMHNYGTVTMET